MNLMNLFGGPQQGHGQQQAQAPVPGLPTPAKPQPMPVPTGYTPGPGLPQSGSGMDPKKAMQFIAKIFGG